MASQVPVRMGSMGPLGPLLRQEQRAASRLSTILAHIMIPAILMMVLHTYSDPCIAPL